MDISSDLWQPIRCEIIFRAYSGEIGHLFQWIPATCSGRFRPDVPVESGHRFRGIPATP
jgi:hypothetical protein